MLTAQIPFSTFKLHFVATNLWRFSYTLFPQRVWTTVLLWTKFCVKVHVKTPARKRHWAERVCGVCDQLPLVRTLHHALCHQNSHKVQQRQHWKFDSYHNVAACCNIYLHHNRLYVLRIHIHMYIWRWVCTERLMLGNCLAQKVSYLAKRKRFEFFFLPSSLACLSAVSHILSLGWMRRLYMYVGVCSLQLSAGTAVSGSNFSW